MRPLTIAQAAAAAVVLRRLGRGRTRHLPLSQPAERSRRTISVVIPARDEAGRIGPCLQGLASDPDLHEVLVVDDCSTDATAATARAHGARVIAGEEPPPGWVGKPWALQQGLEAATGDVVVSLDADTRPRPGLARAMAALLDGTTPTFATVGTRFVCERFGERLLHPAMLATLVYRFGPPDAKGFIPAPDRVISNGQCTAVERRRLLAAGGYRAAAGHMTDDAALARALAADGWTIVFRDGGDLVEVDMHDSAAEVWREWGRSLALRDVTPARRQAEDLAVVWLTLALPPLRLLARRAGPLDLALLAVRAALLGGLARAYTIRGAPFWLSPLADPAVAVRYTLSVLRPVRRWRGRSYAA